MQTANKPLTLSELKRRLAKGTQIRHVWAAWKQHKTGDGTLDAVCTVTRVQTNGIYMTRLDAEREAWSEFPKAANLRETPSGYEYLHPDTGEPFSRYEWI